MKQRLLVVARRFWPLCDESSHRLLNWAACLQSRGVDVTILTSRWHSSWPAESDCREVKLVRLLPAPKSSWTEMLLLRNVATWITQHRQEFDVIYVDESQALLHQVGLSHVRGKTPLISRYAGITQTLANGLQTLSIITHAVDACRKVDRVVASNALAHRQLQSSGIPADRIARIPDVAWLPFTQDPALRRQAALSLRQVNQDMSLPIDVRLLLYAGKFDESSHLEPLIRAAIARLQDNRNFRLWFVGEGSELRRLYDLVKDASCHHEILFHSPFDSFEELFQVADAVVCPTTESGTEFILPSAIAAGIPSMALEASPYRNVMPSVLHGSLLKENTQRNFELAIDDWLDYNSHWKQRADEARREWISSNAIEHATNLWLDLLKNSIRENSR